MLSGSDSGSTKTIKIAAAIRSPDDSKAQNNGSRYRYSELYMCGYMKKLCDPFITLLKKQRKNGLILMTVHYIMEKEEGYCALKMKKPAGQSKSR